MQKLMRAPLVWLIFAYFLFFNAGRSAFWALLVGAGLVGAFVIWPRVQRLQALQRLAQQEGGRLRTGPLWLDDALAMFSTPLTESDPWQTVTAPFRESSVEFSSGDRFVKLEAFRPTERYGIGGSQYWVTRLRVPCQNPTGFRFVMRRGGPAAIVEPGMTPVRIHGDPVLDYFRTAASDSDRAATLLRDRRFRAALVLVTPLRVVVDAPDASGAVQVEKEGLVAASGALREVAVACAEWLESPPPAEASALETVPTDLIAGRAELVGTLGNVITMVEAGSKTGSEHESPTEAKQVEVPVGAASQPYRAEDDPVWHVPSPAGQPISPPQAPAKAAEPPLVSAAIGDANAATVAGPTPTAPVGAAPVLPDPASSEPLHPGLAPQSMPAEAASDVPPRPAVHAGDPLPTVGDTVTDAQWEVTLSAFGPYEKLVGHTAPAGSGDNLVVAEFAVKNLQRWTGTLRPDNLSIEDESGRKFAPSGHTSSIPKGFWLTWVQADQTAEQRAVFELDAAAIGLTLAVLGARFRMPD